MWRPSARRATTRAVLALAAAVFPAVCGARLAAAQGADPFGAPAPLPQRLDLLPTVTDPIPAPAAAAGGGGGGGGAPAAATATRGSYKPRFSRAAPPESRRGATEARVAADKAAAAAAAADPDTAFAAHYASLSAQAAAVTAAGRPLPPNLETLTSDPVKSKARFLEALKEISALNAASGPSLAYGVTPFAHMTKDEFRRHYLSGLAPLGPRGAKQPPGARAAGVGSSPGQYDGSGTYYRCTPPTPWASSALSKAALPKTGNLNINWVTSKPRTVTSIKNQGACGSCVVFADVAALEAAFILAYSRQVAWNTTDLSEQDHMDCITGDSCLGAMGYEYIDRAICDGDLFEKSDPYKQVDTDQCIDALRYVSGVRGYSFVPGNIDDTRRALSHNVMVIGAGVNETFGYYKSGVLPCATDDYHNHAMALVAYTDKVAVKVAGKKAAEYWKVWTVKNSWGDGWGEQGFVRLRADCGTGIGALGMYSWPFNTVPIRS